MTLEVVLSDRVAGIGPCDFAPVSIQFQLDDELF